MEHILRTKGLYFNVKFNIKLLNGLCVQRKYRVLTQDELDKLTCNDVWNDGKTWSVNVYVEGQFYCKWKLSMGERPVAV